MDNDRNFGCFSIFMLFILAIIIASSVDKLTTQVKRIADHLEQQK